MVNPLLRKVKAALTKRPPEVRAREEADVNSLEGEISLTLEDLASLVMNPQAKPKLRALGAWLIGLVKEASLASALEAAALSDPPEEVLWEVTKSLCILKRGAPLFRDLLRHSPNPTTRRAAAYALGCLRDSSAVEVLCHTLSNKDELPSVRGQAAEALGYLQLRSSLAALLTAAGDAYPEVRFWTAFALGQIAAPEAEPVLRSLAASDDALVEGYGSVADEAREALARITAKP